MRSYVLPNMETEWGNIKKTGPSPLALILMESRCPPLSHLPLAGPSSRRFQPILVASVFARFRRYKITTQKFIANALSCSSHSAETLRTMKACRVGRKQIGPWSNQTPPIRGGIFRSLDALDAPLDTSDTPDTPKFISASDADGDAASNRLSDTSGRSSLASLTSESLSVDADEHLRDAPDVVADFPIRLQTRLQRRILPHGVSAAHDRSSGTEKDILPSTAPREAPLTAAEYIDWAVQLGVDRGLRDYPSVDPTVQLDIVKKYRIMHEEVLNEGLYDCPYVEYGKEITRYLILLSLFLTFLHIEWYITSAVFLGLFWVSCRLPQ